MNEPKLKQPRAAGGPCEGGDGYAACNFVLTYECTQCGRREAADDSPKTPLEDESAFDSSAWVGEPVRRKNVKEERWWVVELWTGKSWTTNTAAYSEKEAWELVAGARKSCPAFDTPEQWRVVAVVAVSRTETVETRTVCSPTADVSDECPPRASEREKP